MADKRASNIATPPDWAAEIRKTGYVLENRVAQLLKASGWSVISNKYYIDDVEETAREIDLVAYKVGKTATCNVFTTLIISCKKSDGNVWALLSRDIDLKAPNSDWWPLHIWTNDKVLEYPLAQPEVGRRYHQDIADLGVTDALALPGSDIFAFQEMSRKNGAPQNDKAIFSAITSLMKAQAYELAALPLRKKAPVVYQFNLISIAETELIRLHFDKEQITTHQTESEQYISRYIIRQKETFARVRFINADSFERMLPDYSQLHLANCSWLTNQRDHFYAGAMEHPAKVAVLIERFRSEIHWYLKNRVWQAGPKGDRVVRTFDLSWNDSTKQVVIELEADANIVKFLNEDAETIERVGGALREIYRYSGTFVFVEGIPF